jgi:hypothetical protein
MEAKKELFKKLLNNPKYTDSILQGIKAHDFTKKPLVVHLEGNTFELIQEGNDIKVK